MSLPPGTRIGAYEVIGLLGTGGMGEVYRARDTKLDRDVALKILPPEFATDVERVARFRREAKTLASINHPHIAQIHGLEESADPSTGSGQAAALALVMELVEGEDLSQRIRRSAIPIDEALPVARQIAEALEAAHEQGIVHRDLKPANIKVKSDGTVKVLDFGLAKAVDSGAGSHEPGADQANSPTITSPAMTLRGVILGTAIYMAPEQAKGKPVDRRADIWAFGCVLYEMLTGARAFDGDDTTEILGAIVKTEPDWKRLPAVTPPQVLQLLRRCLQKDVRKRQQHIGDVRIEIDETLHGGEATEPSSLPPRRAWLPLSIAVVTSAAAIAVLALGWPSRLPAATDGPRALEWLLPDAVEAPSGGVPHAVSISPDGRRIAAIGILRGVRHVFLRDGTETEARPLEGTTGAVSCAFSPDGSALAVLANTGRITRVSLQDGLVSTISAASDVLYGVVWMSNDRVAFSRKGEIWAAGAEAGDEQLTALDKAQGEVAHLPSAMLPGGKALLFVTTGADRRRHIEVFRLDTRSRRRLIDDASDVIYAGSGHLVFAKDSRLVAAPFDVDRLALTGAVTRVPDVSSIGRFLSASAISATGTLIYSDPQRLEGVLTWVDRHGAEQPVDGVPRQYLRMRLSPDGRAIAYSTLDAGIWTYDTTRRSGVRVIGGAEGVSEYPVWTPDGKRLLALFEDGVYSVEVGTNAAPARIAGSVFFDFPVAVSPDGRMVAVQRFTPESTDIYFLGLNDPRSALVIKGAWGGVFSPDGRWLAYVSDESAPQVYLASIADSERRYPVSVNGGSQPVWRADGKELFYRNGDAVLAVEVSSAGGQPVFSQPAALFARRYAYGNTRGIAAYDASADGQRFLMIKDQGGRAYLRVVTNFFEVLNRIAPPGGSH